MAFDERLAGRVREALQGKRVTERRMFGGVAWMRDGKMFIGVVKDDLMVRVGPAAHEKAIARPHARTMDFTGRPMKGYVYVGPAGTRSSKQIGPWADEAYGFVGTLDAARRGMPAAAKKRMARRRA